MSPPLTYEERQRLTSMECATDKELRAEIERLADILLSTERTLGKYMAEVMRLEAALREIDALAVKHEKGAIGKAQKIARAALEGKGK